MSGQREATELYAVLFGKHQWGMRADGTFQSLCGVTTPQPTLGQTAPADCPVCLVRAALLGES